MRYGITDIVDSIRCDPVETLEEEEQAVHECERSGEVVSDTALASRQAV